MNRDDTIDLLTAIATRDQRTVGESDIASWGHDLDDVTLQEGLEAVTSFHRSEAATQRRIVAADIMRWTALKRRNQVEWEHVDRELTESRQIKAELYGPEPRRALPPGGLTGTDPSGGRRGESPSLRELWAEVLVVPCPELRCARPAGERCVNRHNGSTTKIPHPRRMKAAERLSHAQ